MQTTAEMNIPLDNVATNWDPPQVVLSLTNFSHDRDEEDYQSHVNAPNFSCATD